MLASVKHFLANEWRQAHAQKRGGGRAIIPWDCETAEVRYRLEPVEEQTPEKVFDRRWALTLLDQVLVLLRKEFAGAERLKQFDVLKVFLTGASVQFRYREAGAVLGISEGAVKTAVHRLRRRFRELLREQLAQTVAAEEEIDEELRYLFAALSP